METTSEINKTIHISRYINEDENFWRKHVIAYPDSGLTKAAYCRENSINYDRFFYWIKKNCIFHQTMLRIVNDKSCMSIFVKKEAIESAKILAMKAVEFLHCHDGFTHCTEETRAKVINLIRKIKPEIILDAFPVEYRHARFIGHSMYHFISMVTTGNKESYTFFFV